MATVANAGLFRNRLGLTVTNNGLTNLTITKYEITFPSANGKLLEVIFPPYFIWQGEKTSPASVTNPDSSRVIIAGDSDILYHIFEYVPALTGYIVLITFSDASTATVTF